MSSNWAAHSAARRATKVAWKASSVAPACVAAVGKHAAKLALLHLESVACRALVKALWSAVARGPGVRALGGGASGGEGLRVGVIVVGWCGCVLLLRSWWIDGCCVGVNTVL